MKRVITAILAAFLFFSSVVCGQENISEFDVSPKEATQMTAQKNDEIYQLLDFNDTQEMEFANSGLIMAPESIVIKAEDGRVIWPQDAYHFVSNSEEAPASANPSLRCNTQYNAVYGLFEVMENIYQVRGYDIPILLLYEARMAGLSWAAEAVNIRQQRLNCSGHRWETSGSSLLLLAMSTWIIMEA